MGLTVAGRNLSRVAWNRAAWLARRFQKQLLRGRKQARESGKYVKAQARGAIELSRDTGTHVYTGAVRTTRYWSRMRDQAIPRLVRDVSIRRELRAIAAGDGPVVVGPWLSEVGYEALYWIPFLRWFTRHYDVDASRLVAVSRGGVQSWYGDIADRYVELLDLFTPEEFGRRNAERQASGDQKQLGLGPFDRLILDRVYHQLGVRSAQVCHPSIMFRLLRQFWLGNESLQYALDYLSYRPIDSWPGIAAPRLPERYVAAKFYTARSLPDTEETRETLRAFVRRASGDRPVVLLDTGLWLDEHRDIPLAGESRAAFIQPGFTPQHNLGVQTEIIRGAELFIGTCGSLAWLAPMLGTPTIAVYADDHFLAPHLYAARHAYGQMDAAPFMALDIRAVTGQPAVMPMGHPGD